MSVSGRAGLFTMDDGKFFGDLRGTPYTSNKRQASGALRLEFGKVTLGAVVTDYLYISTTVTTTIMTGIAAVVSPNKIPTATGISGGIFTVATPGNYTSGKLPIYAMADGIYSGQIGSMDVNYFVVGY